VINGRRRAAAEDAAEGHAQTRFVLTKALELGHKAVVVINRWTARMLKLLHLNATFDLFYRIGATDEQGRFSVIYANGITVQRRLTEDLDLTFSRCSMQFYGRFPALKSSWMHLCRCS